MVRLQHLRVRLLVAYLTLYAMLLGRRRRSQLVSQSDTESAANAVQETQDLLLSFLPKDSQEAAKPMLGALLNTYFMSAGESERENFVTELRAAKASYDDGDEEAIVQLASRFGVTKQALDSMMPAAKAKQAQEDE